MLENNLTPKIYQKFDKVPFVNQSRLPVKEMQFNIPNQSQIPPRDIQA